MLLLQGTNTKMPLPLFQGTTENSPSLGIKAEIGIRGSGMLSLPSAYVFLGLYPFFFTSVGWNHIIQWGSCHTEWRIHHRVSWSCRSWWSSHHAGRAALPEQNAFRRPKGVFVNSEDQNGWVDQTVLFIFKTKTKNKIKIKEWTKRAVKVRFNNVTWG